MHKKNCYILGGEKMGGKWLIEIVEDRPRSYMDMEYLSEDIRYFDKSIEVEKSEIEIENLRLYKLENEKLVKDEELVRKEKEKEKSERILAIKKELSELKVEYSEKEFLYKGKYLQKNREKGDRDNLTGIVVLLMATGQKEYDGWKVLDKDTREHVYLKLSLNDLKVMALHMQEQVTKALKTESSLIEKLETLTDEELKLFNAREEFEKIWNI
jgi:hypothetical protein